MICWILEVRRIGSVGVAGSMRGEDCGNRKVIIKRRGTLYQLLLADVFLLIRCDCHLLLGLGEVVKTTEQRLIVSVLYK